jgi:hypothetical protein
VWSCFVPLDHGALVKALNRVSTLTIHAVFGVPGWVNDQ